jgi:hypothetical protein
MVCNGICIRHEAVLPEGELRYLHGRKRCQVCSVFMVWPSVKQSHRMKNSNHQQSFLLQDVLLRVTCSMLIP